MLATGINMVESHSVLWGKLQVVKIIKQFTSRDNKNQALHNYAFWSWEINKLPCLIL